MAYDKFTCSYFDGLPSRKRLQHDFDYLEDNVPDYLYHYSCGLFRLVVVRNFDSKGLPSSYSLKVHGHPPAFGSWQSLFNSPVLKDVVFEFNRAVASYINNECWLTEDDLMSRGDWFVSEL